MMFSPSCANVPEYGSIRPTLTGLACAIAGIGNALARPSAAVPFNRSRREARIIFALVM